MPTQQTTYNSRITDEALEKRFRDTFRSQGGAELVDDLYAQGVIVPVVDFTQAATGEVLAENLQTAWDFSTGNAQINGTTDVTVISNAGFWQVDLTAVVLTQFTSVVNWSVAITDGTTRKPVWAASSANFGAANSASALLESKFVVFLRSGDSLVGKCAFADYPIDIWYRQIATVSGDLVNPTGFTSS